MAVRRGKREMTAVGLLQQLVTRRAERRPDALAVVTSGESLTYGRLEELSGRMAWLLDDAGSRGCERVALLARKTPRAVVGLLGTLKSGGIAVPLDTANPPERTGAILRSCGARFLLAGDGSEPTLRALRRRGELAHVSVGWIGAQPPAEDVRLDFAWEDLAAQPSAAPPTPISRTDDPAQILYLPDPASRPRGVAIRHSSVLRFVEWAVAHFGIAPYERLSGHSPLHSRLAAFDLFGAFAAGAELHLLAPELDQLPERLVDRLRASGLTQWLTVPSVLTRLASADVVRADDFPELERLIWCGEDLSAPTLRYWMTRLPHVRFTRLFGPAETTIASSYYEVREAPKDDGEPLPLGAACDGEELVVLDPAMRPVAPGEAGELYIRGVGLSPGYWNDVEATRAAFVPDPFSERAGDRIHRTGMLVRVDPRGAIRLVARGADSSEIGGGPAELLPTLSEGKAHDPTAARLLASA